MATHRTERDDRRSTPPDRRRAVDDFRRLELTVTRVGFARGESRDGAPSARYVEYAVDARTVDLTRLRGPNATRIASFDVPPGTYRRAVAHVSHARGTLHDGTRVEVAVPSEPLEVARRLTVGDGGSVSFAFDVVVRRTADGYALRQAP